jgi:hypothetical protein
MADASDVVVLTTLSGARDRRRLGRMTSVAPELVPLLRSSKALTSKREQSDFAADDKDNLRAARGIAMALLAVIPFWCAIAFAVWFLRH